MRRWQWLARAANRLHTTTQPQVVRRFLAFSEGQSCTPLRLAESERILRAQSFIAEAKIVARSDGADGVDIVVETYDEFSIIVAGSARARSPFVTAARLGDGNVMGRAMLMSAGWKHGGFYPDGYSARFEHHQLFGRAYDVSLFAAERSLGYAWAAEARHAFITDLQRAAWRMGATASEGYFSFERENAPSAALNIEQSHSDIGAVIRIGVPGRLSLFGASLSQEQVQPATLPVIISDSGLLADTSSAIIDRYVSRRTARANLLWGVRNVGFMRVSGFDALTGTQDLRTGFQFGTLFGRGLSVLGSEDDDIFVAVDLYAGNGSPRAFTAVQIRGEGRQNFDTNDWDGILGSGRAVLYLKPAFRHTLVTSVEWAGGWRQRTPFQLTLSDRGGGVRGYADSRAGGGQRLVARMEERWFVGRPRGLADLGLAFFADAGRLRAGDAPFGVSTPIKVGVGLGILAAVPPRSNHLWRVDIAFPMSADMHAGWEIRFSNRDITRAFWEEPGDVGRNREPSVPSSLFRWP
ncbi:MAG: hypothetical protein ACRENI_12870 [Gemmatimonadaceae bacterium]